MLLTFEGELLGFGTPSATRGVYDVWRRRWVRDDHLEGGV
jgi:hypothetical protein